MWRGLWRFVGVIICGVLPMMAGCGSTPGGSRSSSGGDSAPAVASQDASGRVTPAKTIDEATSLPVTARSQDQCAFVAPAAWAVTVGEQSAGVDIFNADKTMFASYLVYPVQTAIAPYAYSYPPPMNDPDRYSRDPKQVIRALLRPAVAQHGGVPDLEFTADPVEAIPPYSTLTLRGSTHSALVIYAAMPGDAQSYVIPIRAAIMANQHWPQMAGSLARMAMNIRCTVQLRVPPDQDLESRVERRRDADTEGDEAGYNPWRGSEYVHDANTGQNFIVTSSDWSATGPDGPGYYRRNGNDVTKISPGRSGG